jgi:hypothetical protein
MKRGWTRTLLVTSLLPLMVSALVGCDALGVHPYAGSIIQLSVANAPVTPAGQHLELWARNANNDIIRIEPFVDLTNYVTAQGMMIRPAISLKDPCMTDGHGHLLTSATAYPSSVTIAGVTQTPPEQAQQVIDRINQLAPAVGNVLLAVVPYDPTPPPTIPDGTSPEDRQTLCDNFMFTTDPDKKSIPTRYVANPKQITAPINGTVYGFIAFTTISPPTNYDGFRLDTAVNLKGVQELFFTLETVEPKDVDPLHRGKLFLTSELTQGGRDVVHFELRHADPNDLASGSAAVLFNLDEDPVQF